MLRDAKLFLYSINYCEWLCKVNKVHKLCGPSEATAQRDRSLKIPKYGICPSCVMISHLLRQSIILLRRCIIFCTVATGPDNFEACTGRKIHKLRVSPHASLYSGTINKYRDASFSSHFLNLALQSHCKRKQICKQVQNSILVLGRNNKKKRG